MNTTSSIPPLAETRQYVPVNGFKKCAGDTLFREGYRVIVRTEETLFVVKPDMDCYVVNPYRQTCTCMAGRSGRKCKHLSCMIELVFLTADALEACGNGEEAKRLYDWQWDWSCYHNSQQGGNNE